MFNKITSSPVLSVRDLKIEASRFTSNGISKNVTLVEGVSFDVQKGSVLGLIGESGAGKSTIGLTSMAYSRSGVRITGGEITLNGRNILTGSKSEIRALRGKDVTYVSQSAAASFNPSKRLIDQVIEGTLRHSIMSKPKAKLRAVDLFRKLGLPSPETIGDRYPHQVSGGQLQRVMTAMALCPNPALVVFDEPTTALDVTTQIEVLKAIKEAIQETEVAALYITHDLAVISQVSDEILVLRNGRLVEHGTTAQILTNPQQDYTHDLVNVQSELRDEKPNYDEPLIRVENITARYLSAPIDVLKNVSVTLERGHTLAVVGESGSGKSTLARVITGLLPPLMGNIVFGDHALRDAMKDRTKTELRELQMIYQMADVAINPRQTVGQIIGRPLTFYFGLRGDARKKRVQELLDQIEMGSGFEDRYPAELSGGQKQRICIARALAAKPKLIICDEVTSALDPLVADGILRLLRNLQTQENVAYMFITHDLATVRSIADSIAVIYKGQVVRYGPKSQVLSPPFDDYTDLLLSSVPEARLGWLEEVMSASKKEAEGN